MSRITHMKQSVLLLHWDYLILCGCNPQAALLLQRLEYWDGIKKNLSPDKDTERWIYKSRDELIVELMGTIKEKSLEKALRFLEQRGYLRVRNNPEMKMDRKKQYALQVEAIQRDIHHLQRLLSWFADHNYPIESATMMVEHVVKEGRMLQDITVEILLEKFVSLCATQKLPTAIRYQFNRLEKRRASLYKEDGKNTGAEHTVMPERKMQSFLEQDASVLQRAMHSDDTLPAWRKNTECMSQSLDNNSIKIQQRIPSKITERESTTTLSGSVIAVLDAWDTIHGRKLPRTTPSLEAASQLAELGSTENDIKQVRNHLLKDTFWQKQGVSLTAIAKHFHILPQITPPLTTPAVPSWLKRKPPKEMTDEENMLMTLPPAERIEKFRAMQQARSGI